MQGLGFGVFMGFIGFRALGSGLVVEALGLRVNRLPSKMPPRSPRSGA